ncbi:MAG: response regulator transcription factor [bacterium]|nr:response regulator transcription factor [bacterium]
MTNEAIIRVLVVDDHEVVQRELVSFLNTIDWLHVVGEAATGEEAIALAEQSVTDVVILDMQLSGMNGVQTTVALRQRFPNIRILVLSSFSEQHMVTDVLRAGAIGYLVKSAPLDQIVNAIRAAHEGSTLLSKEAADVLVKPSEETPVELKPRELEVLMLMCRGLTNPQIAAQLFLSRATVKYYVSEILTKLNLSSRTEAVAYAIENGLVTRDV